MCKSWFLITLVYIFISDSPCFQSKVTDIDEGERGDVEHMEDPGIISPPSLPPGEPPLESIPDNLHTDSENSDLLISKGATNQEDKNHPETLIPEPAILVEESRVVGENEDDVNSETEEIGILLICLGGGEDEVVMAQMATLLIRQGHKVTALLYGPGPREEKFPDDIKIYELPVMEGDPLYSDGSGTGVTSGEEGVEWISGRVISSRVLACGSLSRSDWVNKIVERSKLLVTPLFLHDLCVLNLAQRAGVPYVGVLTSRVGSWWVWEQLGTLPLLSTNPVPPSTMEDNSIWSRTVNVARHYRYLSSLRQQWQVPALTALDPSWSPLPLHALYAGLARVLVTWDPLLHAHFPFSSMVVPVGGFSFETGHMTKDLLVSSLKNRAGVITVLPGGREAWLGASALQDVHSALQSTSYTILWKATFPYMQPNVTQEGDVTYNAKFVYKEEVPLNDILSHPRHRLLISTCGESEVMAAVAFATPVICLPVTPDQRLASSQLKSLGVAEVIASADVTVSRIRETVAKMTSDRGYRERCRKLGEEFHDQPLSAADRLLFSLERVIRKPYSRRYENRIINNLYLLQQSNADVYLLLLILLTSIIGFLIALSIMVLPILMKKHKAKAE